MVGSGIGNADFWRAQGSCVLGNPRSKEVNALVARIEAWVSQCAGLEACVWVSTSGSSGRPRFVCLSKAGLLKSAEAVNQHLRVGPADRWLCALPEFHVGGLGIYARAEQSSCVVESMGGRWTPEGFCEALERHRTTLTSLVPTQVCDLVLKKYQCPGSVRVVVVGGESLDPGLGRKARQLGWPVLQSYGLTEAGSQIATEPLEALEDEFSGEWLEVLPGWELREKEVGGCLEIRGEPMCLGYIEISSDGKLEYTAIDGKREWFATGDRVELERKGGKLCLRVLGRMDDVVKVLGEQVSMDRLNQRFRQLLSEHGEVSDGFLLALPEERNGHRIVAFVVAEEASVGGLLEAYQAQVSPYERIAEVRAVPGIPRSALGKVKRQELLAFYGYG